MRLSFPSNFVWGTSSAFAQVKTAGEHQWRGVKSRDGYIFNRTTDHEKRRTEDLGYIKQFGSLYRCSVDWSRLQNAAFEPFNTNVIKEYTDFFEALQAANMKIMFVFHHFTNPLWFENNKGGWQSAENIPAFMDYAKQCMTHFGKYAYAFNTFNEPCVYTMNSFVLGNFPPFKKNLFRANTVLTNLGKAHQELYFLLKKEFPTIQGISKNTGVFRGETLLGKVPAKIADYCFIDYVASFFQDCDFWGISYYALIPFRPFPITEVDNPGELAKLNRPHDKMWAYYPQGLKEILLRFHHKYKKPIWITENGVCTEDSQFRIQSINDYLTAMHEAIAEGVDVIGYTHWSTWDNFEWNLGPTYRFGLVKVDLETKDRTMTDAGLYYAKITAQNFVDIV